MRVYYDRDADVNLIKGKKVAVVGYGSQGHAHANNLKDSGVDVMVGLRKGSASWKKAEDSELKVVEAATAAKEADITTSDLEDAKSRVTGLMGSDIPEEKKLILSNLAKKLDREMKRRA